MTFTDEQVEYRMQGVDYGDPAVEQAMAVELRERLIESEREGRPLQVLLRLRSNLNDLHLGHTVTMRKLRQFQELGHEVTFLTVFLLPLSATLPIRTSLPR